MSSLSQEGQLNAELMDKSLITSTTEIQGVISQIMDTLTYAPLPPYLLLPASSFRADITELLQRHLSTPPVVDSLSQDQQESALWSKPDLVFFDCRANLRRFGTWAYNKSLGELKFLGEQSEDIDRRDGLNCITALPIYRIISLGYRKGIAENRVALQARTTNLTVWYQERNGIDWYEQNNDEDKERDIPSTGLDQWLGDDIVELAQSRSANGSWLPYVRNLLGLTEIEPPQPNTPITPINLPLSSLIVLFLKCSNLGTTSFLSVYNAGDWTMPAIEGNQGRNRHLFCDATDEVTVRVI